MSDFIINIGFWLLEKIPGALILFYKFISPIRIEPNRLDFNVPGWERKLSLCLKNIGKRTIYDIQILLPIESVPFEAITIKTRPDKEGENIESIHDISINYSVYRLNIKCELSNYIILNIYQLEPNHSYNFKIKVSGNLSIKPRILGFKQKENPILTQQNKVAITGEISKKFPCKKAFLVGFSILMKRTKHV